MTYVGISTSAHDPAIAIVNDAGELLFAEATERFLQNKRAVSCLADGMPFIDSIIEHFCDPDAPLLIAKSWSRSHCTKVQLANIGLTLAGPILDRAKMLKACVDRNRYMLRMQESSLLFSGETLRYNFEYYHTQYHRHLLKYQRSVLKDLTIPSPGKQTVQQRVTVQHLNHHLTHAAAACFGSPFDEAVCAVIDGFGEGTSTAFFRYEKGRLTLLPVPQSSKNSLGFFYAGVCMACGFNPEHGEEWKVMGLAPYGQLNPAAYEKLRLTIKIDGLRIIGLPRFFDSDVWKYCRSIDRADLAFTGQTIFEECMKELLGNLNLLGVSSNLVLTGGCALNSSMNGKILASTRFKRLYVPSAPGDDGTALGAALLAYSQRNQNKPKSSFPAQINLPYSGSKMEPRTLENLTVMGCPGNISCHPGAIHAVTARLLAEGKIVGWIQGRSEFGPRALGNRSILADPRNVEMKENLNKRVKFREDFRPFAPAILHEYGPDYFDDYQESPFMERALRFKSSMAGKVPAVVHVDRTGRLQTVKREWNALYYDLIVEFLRLTGVPIILNTSFNIMGKPIIHSVEDALGVLFSTGMDALVIEDHLIIK